MDVFRRRGYDGASIQELVEATGVGRGSLYGAFGSKEGLYLAAIDLYRERYAEPLVELLRSGAPARDLVREVLVAVVDEVATDGEWQACLIVGAAIERVHLDAVVAGRVRAVTRGLQAALSEVIAAGQRDGQLKSKRDPRELAAFIAMTIHGLRVMGAITRDRRILMGDVEVAIACLD